ncbi:hypothetical protein AAFF_G00255490 [Aldrovandia affinis]|uniref:Uncharacterized protein n=1 Tax=Aldrovandia affinis TaxID=143900 RepID=A0AAD7RCL6_9TELE|nr:hypothetical protein AAFF_G00255490 [Aldrovandia affinis]
MLHLIQTPSLERSSPPSLVREDEAPRQTPPDGPRLEAFDPPRTVPPHNGVIKSSVSPDDREAAVGKRAGAVLSPGATSASHTFVDQMCARDSGNS